MSQTAITFAFEQWKAQEAAAGKAVVLDEFVLAYIPGLDHTLPINRAEKLPPAAQIVHRQAVNKIGVVNDNAVVYSVTLGTEVGDFDFNWLGLVNKASGTVAMIVHAPTQRKVANVTGQQGNVLTRSFLMEYNGAATATGITTPAETWQIDFTARLTGIDEMQRLINVDNYGVGAFLGAGYLVAKTGTQFFVTKGVGYVGGIRADLPANLNIAVPAAATKVWADVSFQGNITSKWTAVIKITVAPTLANYSQSGFMHYVFAIASIDAAGNITDLRPKGSLTDDALAKHEQSRNHPDGTLLYKGFVRLNSAVDSDSELLAATPKAVKIAMDNANARLAKDRNGADIPNVPLFRQNLALKGAALVDIGKVAGTVAAGDDSRIVNALPATGGTMTGPLKISGIHGEPIGPAGYRSFLIGATNCGITNPTGTGIGLHSDKNIYFWNDDSNYAMTLSPTSLSVNRPINISNVVGAAFSIKSKNESDVCYIMSVSDTPTKSKWYIGNTQENNTSFDLVNSKAGVALKIGDTISTTAPLSASKLTSGGDVIAGGGATTYQANGDIKGAAWANGLLSTYINAMRSTSALSGNGWSRDPVSKMIIQWCTGPAIIHETLNVVTKFPIPFPAACLMAHVSTKNPAQDINSDVWYQVASWDNTSATCILQRPGGGTAGAAVYPLFIAIGF
ncbi:phage tail protein [Yersinia kristensenii]|uniref:phage tail-collar fiber domain-containing protein n=1 Tax=Yersinia kristensenii TaxID=28152 RepID=UPI001C608AF5|nr:phage tail protein [Yersinia kristensenii]MBW5829188.1 phage tail protein [Yersinia kristensenii]